MGLRSPGKGLTDSCPGHDHFRLPTHPVTSVDYQSDSYKPWPSALAAQLGKPLGDGVDCLGTGDLPLAQQVRLLVGKCTHLMASGPVELIVRQGPAAAEDRPDPRDEASHGAMVARRCDLHHLPRVRGRQRGQQGL
jgi:hypothetical protein